ncbi:ATP phosphoribosyltransferase [Salisaeta longa]|uniref:ATP phosphoribosyltransferase n=1 Tax=Salisaeta longa TaxID=503170 RepID=UPI0003B73AAA|nr:ATP phosphoribosyltransferase [Salisaeta longa]
MLKIALPNKGALSDGAVALAAAAGYRCRRRGRELSVRDTDNDVMFIFLRPRDIATYVSNGTLDLGVTGLDLLHDSGANVERVMDLNFGNARFCYAAPKEQDITPDDFTSQTRIATSYANLVRKDLDARDIDATVVHLDGAVEISIDLGVADAIADVVQTGRTIDEAGLHVIGDPILETEAVLVAQNGATLQREAAQRFIERVQGILMARAYVMVEYDLPRDQLATARDITPGIESPTVSPLSKDGWVAVKAMAREARVNEIMDDLTAIGAKGIIITDIRTCRI